MKVPDTNGGNLKANILSKIDTPSDSHNWSDFIVLEDKGVAGNIIEIFLFQYDPELLWLMLLLK